MGRFGRKLGNHFRDSVQRIFGQKTIKNKYVAISQNASAEHNGNEVCDSKQDKQQPHSSRPQRLESLSGSVSTLTSTADHYTFRSQEQGYLVEDLSSVEGSNSISTKPIVRANCEGDKNQATLFASAGDISERSDRCNGKEQPTINIQREKDSKSTKPDKSQKVKVPWLTRRFEHDLLVCTDEIDGSKLMKLEPRSARSELKSGSNCDEDNAANIEHPAVFSHSITSNKIIDRGLGRSHNSKSILKNLRRLKTVEMEEAELEQERLIGGVNNRTAGDGMNASKALFASQKYRSPADQIKIKTLWELNEGFVNLLTKRLPDRHHLLKKLQYEPFLKENGTIDTDAERKSLFRKIQINRCSENISQRSNQGVLRELHNSTTDSNGTLMAHLSLNKPSMKYEVTASTKVCSHKKPVGSKWSNKWWAKESPKCNGIIGCTQMNKKDRVKINDKRQLSGRKDKLKTIESPMTTVVMSQFHNSSSEEVQELSSEQGVLEIGHLNERPNDVVCKQLVAEQEQNQSLANESERSEEVCQRRAGGPLNLCPTGLHEVYAKSKTCVCMHAETLAVLQSEPVISEWHTGEPETILVDGNEVTPRSTLGRKPSLGEFELMKPVRIRSGGQGTVAWVQNPETLMQYALKFKIRDDRNASSWRIERREAIILRNLQYPFVVKTFHIYETETALFMAFEYLEGGCLWNHIARAGTLPECYVTYYAACILSALVYLHDQCIVYRDLKAENIVLDSQHRPKLIDFGMAKFFPSIRKHGDGGELTARSDANDLDSSRRVKENGVLNDEDLEVIEMNEPPTRYYFAAYLAPEIYSQPNTTTQFIDSWGLGYIVVEMVLGYGIFMPMPWENTPGQHLSLNWTLCIPEDARENLSSECLDFIYKMLVRQPSDRMSLPMARDHAFFARVPWRSLTGLCGPNLTKFRSQESTEKRQNGGVIHDPCHHKADPAFIQRYGKCPKTKLKQEKGTASSSSSSSRKIIASTASALHNKRALKAKRKAARNLSEGNSTTSSERRPRGVTGRREKARYSRQSVH